MEAAIIQLSNRFSFLLNSEIKASNQESPQTFLKSAKTRQNAFQSKSM